MHATINLDNVYAFLQELYCFFLFGLVLFCFLFYFVFFCFLFVSNAMEKSIIDTKRQEDKIVYLSMRIRKPEKKGTRISLSRFPPLISGCEQKSGYHE